MLASNVKSHTAIIRVRRLRSRLRSTWDAPSLFVLLGAYLSVYTLSPNRLNRSISHGPKLKFSRETLSVENQQHVHSRSTPPLTFTHKDAPRTPLPPLPTLAATPARFSPALPLAQHERSGPIAAGFTNSTICKQVEQNPSLQSLEHNHSLTLLTQEFQNNDTLLPNAATRPKAFWASFTLRP